MAVWTNMGPGQVNLTTPQLSVSTAFPTTHVNKALLYGCRAQMKGVSMLNTPALPSRNKHYFGKKSVLNSRFYQWVDFTFLSFTAKWHCVSSKARIFNPLRVLYLLSIQCVQHGDLVFSIYDSQQWNTWFKSWTKCYLREICMFLHVLGFLSHS